MLKKFMSTILALSMLLTLSTFSMATECCESYEHSSHLVPLSNELLIDAIERGILPKTVVLASPTSSCSHGTYSSDSIVDAWHEPGESYGDCNVLVVRYAYYCTLCNQAFMRDERTQLSHDWDYSSGGTVQTCKICNYKISYVRSIP